MVVRTPLVLVSGQVQELAPSDTLLGSTPGVLIAGSGLTGGGDLSSSATVNVSLATNASGLIFVGSRLGVDGVALTTSSQAIASGSAANPVSLTAIASGVSGSSLASTASASGNAALIALNANPGGTFASFTAASAILSGYPVGFDDTLRVQAITQNNPKRNSQSNYIGIAQQSVSSGSSLFVRLPGSYDRTNSNLTAGAFYYLNPTTSGLTTTATQPTTWSGNVPWGPIGRAVNSTTLLLTDML